SAPRASLYRPRGCGTARSNSSCDRQQAASMTLQSPHPREPGSHAGAGSKTSCFVSRYGWRVSRGRAEVKLRSAGVSRRPLARGGDVERDLTAQILDARELPLFPEASDKDQPDPLGA